MPALNHFSIQLKLIIVIAVAMVSACAVKRNERVIAPAFRQEFSAKVFQPSELKNHKILRYCEALLPQGKLREQLYAFYQNNDSHAYVVNRFLASNELDIFIQHLKQLTEHGLHPKLFPIDEIDSLLAEVKSKSADSTAINRMKLEILISSTLIRYAKILQYGGIDPTKIYRTYESSTLLPDSNFVSNLLHVNNLKAFLDSMQPKEHDYLKLQKSLAILNADDRSDSLKVKKLVVNLERLRWGDKPAAHKYVSVNIPSFLLSFFDEGLVKLTMKVCVGEVGDHETPELASEISSVQVNPVWNIPPSIARDDILRKVTANRYYLNNNSINTYFEGKLVNQPETIDWLSADINEYWFQQQPGYKNALGKIKFLFYSENNIYLHDTPEKKLFAKKNRAFSHGCIRVEKPLQLANMLFGEGIKYNNIKNAFQSGQPKAKFIGLLPHVPIRIFYHTAAVESNGLVNYYNDIYRLDDRLYSALQQKDLGFDW